MNTKLPATLRAGLVAIINLLDGRDTSRGTAVTTRPLPMWQPERLIERETVFVVAPVPQPAQPQPEPKQKPLVHYTRQWRYGYESGGMYWLNPDNRPAAPSAVNEIYEAAKDGRLVIIDMIPNVPWLPHERELWQMNEAAKHGHVAPAQMSNGRIVMQD